MENTTLTLADIPSHKSCVIVKVNGHGGFRHRIMEMGFVKGERVSVVKNAPLLDPIEYEVMQNHVSLRRSEARHVEVVEFGDESTRQHDFNGTLSEEVSHKIIEKTKTITVALLGNPNCGKTSFFNHATGLREKVGNYSGVTVDSKIGTFYQNGYTIHLVDLPGTYSITEYTPEEVYVRSYLAEQQPDVVLNIVDASNLERNLFLTTQLIDMNVRMVMALNMYDELDKSGSSLDYKSLSKMLGFPIIPTVSSRGIGITEILNSIIDIYEDKLGASKHIHINYGINIENAIQAIKQKVEKNLDIINLYPSRYIAIKLIENDSITLKDVSGLPNYEEIKTETEKYRKLLEKEYNEDTVSIVTNVKYGFIRGALKETFNIGNEKINHLAYAVDTVLTNKWLGFPVLLLFMWIMFQTTFTVGAYPQEWIEMGVDALGQWVAQILPEGMLNDLLVDGVIAGVGGVIVFLPNILILFLFISLLEDTGYMARAAFIMDKLMHKMGLHGKSFIPYLIGFGCGVPAIMATRTLENRKDRIITILTIPFMSCSARLPVYLLIVSAFFTAYQGLILMSIYLLGVLVAISTALLLKKVSFKDESDQFVMELPPYRIPTFRNTLIHMWDKSVLYLKKMGTVILVASVIIWALGYFPQENEQTEMLAQRMEQVQADAQMAVAEQDSLLAQYDLQIQAAQREGSYIGLLGHAIEPVMAPLGFDWRMSVSILTGLAAKEIVVSSMGILFQADVAADEESEHLITTLQNKRYTTGEKVGQPIFTPLIAYGFMIFVLLYFPCIAALSAIRKEAGPRWAWFSMLYTTAVAWVVSCLIYQIGSLF